MVNKVGSRKDFFISTVRDYLKSRGLSYAEYEAPSGSVYFHVDVGNRHSNPCIRISNHPESNQKSHVLTLLYTASKNANQKVLKMRIQRSIDNMITRTNKYSMYKCLEELKG